MNPMMSAEEVGVQDISDDVKGACDMHKQMNMKQMQQHPDMPADSMDSMKMGA